MKMKSSLPIIITLIVITSCNSVKEIKQKNLSSIDKNFSESFTNLSIKKDSSTRQVTILELLQINENQNIDDFKLIIQKNEDLKIEYKNILGVKNSQVFKGKFKKRYYQVFLQRDQIFFPPIYWIKDIERLRFSISKDSMLVINKYSDHSGMILLFGAGSSWKEQYCFKNLKK